MKDDLGFRGRSRPAKCASMDGALILLLLVACSPRPPMQGSPAASSPHCPLATATRVDAHQPEVVAPGWEQPQPLGPTVNTHCPEDAIEISLDGRHLYFLFTTGPLAELSPDQIFSDANGTFRALRLDGPGEFGPASPFDLGKGANGSLDGELSFSPDGRLVYFHSLRADNTGYRQDPRADDFLDIYVAEVSGAEPGPGRNLGSPVNSPFPDGEHALHPDGVTLYFASSRPGGLGGTDIWTSTLTDGTWSEPVNLGAPINSPSDELQPAFVADGNTMYFTSDRLADVGAAIFRSARAAEGWSEPELVVRGIVGEPSLTADGLVLYFVHVLTDAAGIFDADVWYSLRSP